MLIARDCAYSCCMSCIGAPSSITTSPPAPDTSVAPKPPTPAPPPRKDGSLARANVLSEVYSLRRVCCCCRLSERICSTAANDSAVPAAPCVSTRRDTVATVFACNYHSRWFLGPRPARNEHIASRRREGTFQVGLQRFFHTAGVLVALCVWRVFEVVYRRELFKIFIQSVDVLRDDVGQL